MPKDANLDELWDITKPRFSMHPFGIAVKELIGERSLRQFAAKRRENRIEWLANPDGLALDAIDRTQPKLKCRAKNALGLLKQRIEKQLLRRILQAGPTLQATDSRVFGRRWR